MNRYRGGVAITLATILLFQGTGLLLLQNNNNYAMAQSGGGGSLYNYAPYFTATGSNSVGIADNPELRLQQQFSVSAWFRTTINNNSQVAIIVNKGGFQSDTPGTPQQNYGIWLTGSNQGTIGRVEAGFEDANGRDYFVRSPNTYNDGQWHYAVVTFDGSTLNLYVDGSLVATRTNITAIPHTSNTPLVIGKDSNGNNRYFRGDIDEVRIYNRALTAQEVNDAYNNGVFASNGLLISVTFTPPQADNKDVSTNENTSIDVTLTASDSDNYESLTFEIVTPPSNGTLSSITPIDARSARVTYTPNTGFTGTDTFTYRARDNNNAYSNLATVTIQVNAVNHPPQAVNDSYSTDEDTPLTVPAPGVLSNDSDPDGDPISIIGYTNPSNGTLTFNTSDGSFTYTPNPNFNGTDTFTYTITDGNSSSTATVTIEVMPVNDAPQAVDDYYSMDEDDTLTVNGVLSNDSDPDGNTIFAELVDNPSNGTLTLLEDGSFTYTPNTGFTGTDTFTYRARDNNNAYSNTVTVTIQVKIKNKPPVADNVSVTTDEDTPVDITLSARDPNRDPITFEIVNNPTNGILSNFDANNGTVTYTPNPNFNGTDTFTYRARDSNGLQSNTATVTITINPVNDPPIANAGSDQTVDEGTLVTLNGSSSYDPDGDTLTYQWVQIQGPSVTLNNANTATPSFTAPIVNSDTLLRFRLTVSDGSLSSTSEVTVTVRDIAGGYRYAPYFTATGSNSVSIADKQELRLTNFTVSAWFRTSSTFTNDAMIVNKGGSGSETLGQNMNYGVWLLSDGKVRGGFEESNGTDRFVTSSNRYNDGQWHYVVVTYDRSVLRLYIDGVLVASLNTTVNPDNNGNQPLVIGRNSLQNNKYFIGDIDEVRVYNRALTAQEVSDAYNRGIFTTNGLIVLQSFTPPIANPTSVTTDEDTAIQITLTATDVDNYDTLTFSIVTNPTKGSLSSMTRIDNNSVRITYTPNANVNGLDIFTFKVNDGISDSNTATVTITINPVNDPPIANAGSDQTVDEGTLVTLDGSSSYDPDGDTLTYQWVQIQGPSVTLNNANTATPSFTAPIVNSDTLLRFRLTVSDGSLSSTSEVTVTVRDIAGGYRYAPYFTATGSNSVSIADKQELRLQQFSVSAWFRTTMNNNSQVAIIVNKGGFGNGDGSNVADMNYGIWITGTSDQAPQGRVAGGFETDSGTNYFVFSNTTYNDGQWHYVVVTYDKPVNSQGVLRLYIDGVLISSLNTPSTAVPDYNWNTPLTIGKTALTNVNGFYFIGDIDEVRVYNRALTAQEIDDAYNNGIFATNGLLLKIGFTPPIANAGSDQTVDEGTLVTLNGSSSYDPDGDTLTYQWVQIQGPSVTLSDPSSPTPSFTASFVDVITTLKFRLTVSDGVQSSQAIVSVYVRNTSAYDYYPWFTLKGSDFFNVADEPSLRLQQFSVSAWFRTSSTFTSPAIIVNKGGFDTSASKLNYGLWITTNGTLQGGFEESNGTDRFVTSSNRYNDGQWHYVVLTYDGSILRLYVDGSLVSSLNTTAVPATDTMPLTIGKNSSSNSRYFIGDIDEVRIYNRALTAQEVNDAYNGTFTSNGLLIYLDMRHELLLSGVTNMEDLYYFDLLNEMKNAKRKIHVVVFWMEYNNNAGSNYRPNVILNAIKDAKNRGVDVRLMYYYESEQVYPDLVPFLTNNGIPYKTVSTHAKIINIDGKLVYIGSGNINNNGLRNNHEIFIKSYNANIIDRATKYLDRLWAGSGSRSFSDDGYDNIMVSDGYFNSVLNAIQNARDTIRIIMFLAGGNYDMSGQLLTALNDAKNRGVSVKVIVDYDFDGNYDGIPDNNGVVSYLKSKGIPVKSDEGEPPRTHIKLVVVDDTTYIGSHNWVNEQLASTNEASVKLKSPFILQKAMEYFDWKWSRGRTL